MHQRRNRLSILSDAGYFRWLYQHHREQLLEQRIMLLMIQMKWHVNEQCLQNCREWIIPLKLFLTIGSVILHLSDISFARVIKAYLAFLDWNLMWSSTWWLLDETGTRIGTDTDPCSIMETFAHLNSRNITTLCHALFKRLMLTGKNQWKNYRNNFPCQLLVHCPKSKR